MQLGEGEVGEGGGIKGGVEDAVCNALVHGVLRDPRSMQT